jgi:hypothetical protein
MTVFWDIAKCSFVEVNRRFRESKPTFQRCVLPPPPGWWITVRRPDETGSTHLQNVGLLNWNYTALHPIKQPSSKPTVLDPIDKASLCLPSGDMKRRFRRSLRSTVREERLGLQSRYRQWDVVIQHYARNCSGQDIAFHTHSSPFSKVGRSVKLY